MPTLSRRDFRLAVGAGVIAARASGDHEPMPVADACKLMAHGRTAAETSLMFGDCPLSATGLESSDKPMTEAQWAFVEAFDRAMHAVLGYDAADVFEPIRIID